MRALSLVPVLFVAGLLAACNPSEEEFPEAYGKAVCTQLKKCDRGDYDSNYDDRDDCVGTWADGMGLWMNTLDFLGADYSEQLAGDCLSEIRRANCEEFTDGDFECDVYE